MRRTPPAALLSAALVLVLTACGSDSGGDGPPAAAAPATPGGDRGLTTTLLDAAGGEAGTVEISFTGGAARVSVEVRGLEPGFHGLHLHETGVCEPDSASPSNPSMTGAFLSAGGHLAPADEDHGDHAGDLPPLLVAADGTAVMTVVSDRLSEADALDADGSAVMVHAGPDNLGNVPERYAPGGPDQMTLDTGDSGGRVACAVLTAG